MDEFSRLLTKYIERTGITDSELARRLGVNRSTIYRWKSDPVKPRDEELIHRCADILRLSPKEKAELLLAAGFPQPGIPPPKATSPLAASEIRTELALPETPPAWLFSLPATIWLRVLTSALIVSLALLGVAVLQLWRLSSAEPMVSIENLDNGDSVGHQHLVVGTSSGLQPGWTLYVVIHAPDGRFYPQAGTTVDYETGRWSVETAFGREGDTDQSKSFKVLVAVATDSETDRMLSDSHERYYGLRELPEEALLFDQRISVTLDKGSAAKFLTLLEGPEEAAFGLVSFQKVCTGTWKGKVNLWDLLPRHRYAVSLNGKVDPGEKCVDGSSPPCPGNDLLRQIICEPSWNCGFNEKGNYFNFMTLATNSKGSAKKRFDVELPKGDYDVKLMVWDVAGNNWVPVLTNDQIALEIR